jgi:hypothetical protein
MMNQAKHFFNNPHLILPNIWEPVPKEKVLPLRHAAKSIDSISIQTAKNAKIRPRVPILFGEGYMALGESQQNLDIDNLNFEIYINLCFVYLKSQPPDEMTPDYSITLTRGDCVVTLWIERVEDFIRILDHMRRYAISMDFFKLYDIKFRIFKGVLASVLSTTIIRLHSFL